MVSGGISSRGPALFCPAHYIPEHTPEHYFGGRNQAHQTGKQFLLVFLPEKYLPEMDLAYRSEARLHYAAVCLSAVVNDQNRVAGLKHWLPVFRDEDRCHRGCPLPGNQPKFWNLPPDCRYIVLNRDQK